ncbi:MAG: protein translocase subunit SecD [Chlorobia bacterium]|nr:protein translocase subunit SecD [Fimbriimonadaceae bacterium]
MLSGLGYYYKAPNLGLDIKGGVRLTYKMDLSKLKAEERQSLGVIQSNVIKTITNRATGLIGVVEPLVQAKGTDEVIVELPGYTDEKTAKQVLKTTASIELYWAKTVNTGAGVSRIYEDIEQRDFKGTPGYVFRRNNSSTDIVPGTPEYKTMIRSWGDPILKGDDLDSAGMQPKSEGYIPTMKFSKSGASKMETWTRANQRTQPQLASVLDDVVISIAPLKQNTVIRDEAVIDGVFETAYVRTLIELLNSGSLPVSLELTSSQKVDPTIGAQALDKIVIAGIASFAFIAIFLIVYYAFPGFVALIALGLYVLFTLTVMKWINATFSLAAIAGFILSVGMAVDANILVFERFKEEMKAGKSLQTALELGFKRALPAIFDSNACTILTSIVLANLGTGPVKGFASTLIIGVAISLFTAVVVTRSLLIFLVGSGIGANPKFYALERSWFGEKFETTADEKPLQIVNTSKKWFAISIISILVFLPFWFIGGLRPSVEFRGGYEVELLAPTQTASQIQASLKTAQIDGANVKFAGEGITRAAIITVPLEVGQSDPNAAESVAAKVVTATGLSRTEKGGTAFVGPSIQKETVRNAILGVIISAVLIVLWLTFRFGVALGNFVIGLRFGMSAILALLHDVFVVLGLTAVVGYFYGWEVSALFLTSMLTVIGFSVHDTIVIFDRIRENLRKPHTGEDFGNLVNRSITQSYARSLNTSMTVIVTLVILLVFGTATPDLKLFCVTMLGGIISGTYSSIYNASPILYLWDKAVIRRKGEAQSILGLARAENMRARAASTLVEQPVRSEANTDTTGTTYGQVRRRASAVKNSKIELDD